MVGARLLRTPAFALALGALAVAGAAPAEAASRRAAAERPAAALPAGAAGAAALAVDLLAALAATDAGNLAVSPYGVAAALSALDLGADATMKAAIARTLRAGKAGVDGVRRDDRLIGEIATAEGSPIATANALFYDSSLILAAGIETEVRAEARVDVRPVDFATPDGVAAANAWVKTATRGQIDGVLSPGETPAMVAANAFAFRADWRTPFDPAATAPKPFHRADGAAVERPTMQAVAALGHARSGAFTAVEIPYLDGRFAMTVVVRTTGPTAVADYAGARDLVAGAGLAVKDVRLTLPKFTAAGDLDLLKPLGGLGLKAGLASANQLSGFGDGLRLGGLRQKATIAVDETGTVAAAATAAVVTRGDHGPAKEPVEVVVDRPFLYALRHRATGAVLMAGYVADPAGTSPQAPAAAPGGAPAIPPAAPGN
jgi:serpin B